MSDYEGETFDTGGEEFAGEPGGLPEFDPFDPDSVTAYNDARDERLLSAVAELLPGQPQPTYSDGYEDFELPDEELSEDDALRLAEGEQAAFDHLAQLQRQVGDFDAEEAYAAAEATFEQLPPEYRVGEVGQQVARALLEQAADTAAGRVEGNRYADRLVAAEAREYPGVDPEQVKHLASEILPYALKYTDGDSYRAGQVAIEAAVRQLAGVPEGAYVGDPSNATANLVQKYAVRNQVAISRERSAARRQAAAAAQAPARDESGRFVAASPAEHVTTVDGSPVLSPSQLARKYGARI